MKLFTSDWHLNHDNIRKPEYSNRPFNTIRNMEDDFYHNLKLLYKPGDILYFLGDLCFANKERVRMYMAWFKAIRVKQIVFIFGNHDYTYRNVIKEEDVLWSGDMKVIKLCDGTKTFLSHYPFASWPRGYMLHGHSHGTLESALNRLDVGIDNAYKLLGEYRPFTEEEIIEILKDTSY